MSDGESDGEEISDACVSSSDCSSDSDDIILICFSLMLLIIVQNVE